MKSERWYSEEGDIMWYLPFEKDKPDRLHRLDGPAIEFANGQKAWYYKGIKIDCQTQEEFEHKLKLLAFL